VVYVGARSQDYAVHVPILTTFHVLGSKRLEEAEDGSYCMTLPDEDPIQFERLLAYMYEGTWEPEAMASCGGECRWVRGACTHWDNKKYMQLYVTACKYGAYGLADKIASNLDLEESVLRFCEAFKDAYEKCPGNAGLRGPFQRSLLLIFENNLRNSPELPQYDDLGNNKSLAAQLAELVSRGGEFAVDLMQAFAMAKESAIQATMSESQPFGCNDWPISDVEKSDTWDCQPRAEADNDTGCWGETAIDSSNMVTREEVKKIQERLFDLEEVLAESGRAAVIREDGKNVQGRLRSLEDMVSNLQLSLGAKSTQTQHTGFSNALAGIAQPCIPQGLGPSVSLQQPSRFQPGFDHCAVDETKGPRYRAWVKEQEARDKLIFHPLYQPFIQSENYVDPASSGWYRQDDNPKVQCYVKLKTGVALLLSKTHYSIDFTRSLGGPHEVT
jgi:hypothetical protein